MIKPKVRLFFSDGTRKRAELYDRPAMIMVKVGDGEVPFIRCGADEYRESKRAPTRDHQYEEIVYEK